MMSIQDPKALSSLRRLIDDLWENRLDEHGAEELAQLLSESAELQQLYVEAVHLHASLISWSMAGRDRVLLSNLPDHQAASGIVRNLYDAPKTPSDPTTSDESTDAPAKTSLTAKAPGKWLRRPSAWLAIAIVLALSGTWWIATNRMAGEMPARSIAQGTNANHQGGDRPHTDRAQSPDFVAQITGVSDDVQWSKSSTASDFLLRVREGQRVSLLEGFAELHFASGATVVLHGPVEFEVTGSDSGRLLSGVLTGYAKDGNFLLTTPSANVLDLGTAFGVAVDSGANTDVVVFEGDVRVASTLGENWNPTSMHLKAGMGARVATDGSIVPGSKLAAEDFLSTKLEAASIDELNGELSLVDLLNTHTRTSASRPRPVGTIDPMTGRSFPQPWLERFGPGVRHGDGLYHVTNWHPFVDGIFVPTSEGVDVQIDSQGHRVDLPENFSRTWGPVWSRRTMEAPMSQFESCDFWGNFTLPVLQERFKACRLGMMGMHADVGITIKLDEIRNTYDVDLKSITAIVANLDNSREHDLAEGYGVRERPRFSADVRVYLDGQLVYSRLDFARADGELAMQIPLTEDSRFLTIVSTDAMHNSLGNAYDHVVLIDPVIHFEKMTAPR